VAKPSIEGRLTTEDLGEQKTHQEHDCHRSDQR
jgi:hypothetical protein